jgi:hypothetical protein
MHTEGYDYGMGCTCRYVNVVADDRACRTRNLRLGSAMVVPS